MIFTMKQKYKIMCFVEIKKYLHKITYNLKSNFPCMIKYSIKTNLTFFTFPYNLEFRLWKFHSIQVDKQNNDSIVFACHFPAKWFLPFYSDIRKCFVWNYKIAYVFIFHPDKPNTPNDQYYVPPNECIQSLERHYIVLY